MDVVIVGAAGQLGTALAHELRPSAAAPSAGAPSAAVLALTRHDLDATSLAQVEALQLRPDTVVINCAAYTAVDAAETEVDSARALNEHAPRLLASRCAQTGARLIHISTDYVFGGGVAGSAAGDSSAAGPFRPWEPTDPTNPTSVYGRTKLAGELAASAADPRTVIVRTAWVYTGRLPDRSWAPDFVGTMGRLATGGATPRVVNDQTGSPTYAPDLAHGIAALARLLATEPDRPGQILHAAGTGSATWFDVASAVFSRLSDAARVTPCTTADFPRPAPRPTYSVLSPDSWLAAGLAPLPHWRDALERALD